MDDEPAKTVAEGHVPPGIIGLILIIIIKKKKNKKTTKEHQFNLLEGKERNHYDKIRPLFFPHFLHYCGYLHGQIKGIIAVHSANARLHMHWCFGINIAVLWNGREETFE